MITEMVKHIITFIVMSYYKKPRPFGRGCLGSVGFQLLPKMSLIPTRSDLT
jgi:hypothetical protein